MAHWQTGTLNSDHKRHNSLLKRWSLRQVFGTAVRLLFDIPITGVEDSGCRSCLHSAFQVPGNVHPGRQQEIAQ